MRDSYQLREVERRVAEDDRTSELGVRLAEHGGRLFVRGQVSSQAARGEVLAVIREMCPEAEVVDELTCDEASLGRHPETAEDIR